jgi:MSHA biogenesis protein MshK
MTTRVCIELSPTTCRIVEVEGGSRRGARGGDTCVRAVAALPLTSAPTRPRLAALRGRRVAVVAWGVRNYQCQLVVSRAPYERMRAEALSRVRERMGEVGVVDLRRMLADIAPAGPGDGEGMPVVLTVAASDDVRSVLAPLVEAGIRVESVVTPAVALTSLARSRRALGVPGAVEAYVALEETATCVALIRSGALVASREFTWGYLDERGALRAGEEIAGQLADDLGRLFGTTEPVTERAAHVCICGGLPELRTTAVRLMERLNLEVEPLDSLYGIDAERLPEPAERFCERIAALRIAWAVAADVRAPLNLVRDWRWLAIRAGLARAAVVAGVTVGFGAGWWIAQSAGETRAGPAAVASTAARAMTTTSPWRLVSEPTQRIASGRSTVRNVDASTKPPPSALPVPRAVAKPLPATSTAAVAPAAVRLPRPVMAGPARRLVAVPPLPARTRPSPPSRRAGVEPTRSSAAKVQRAVSVAIPARGARERSGPVPTPFDAVLRTILYSPERRLAIIDGRIVQMGDEIKGARVIDIAATTVLLRDAKGRLRSLTLAASSP